MKIIIHFCLVITGVISILSLQSCQVPGFRKPSAEADLIDSKKLEENYALNIELLNLHEQEKKVEARLLSTPDGDPTGSDADKLKNIQGQIAKIEKRISENDNAIALEADHLGSAIPQTQWGEFNRGWRKQKEKLIISEPVDYALKDGKIVREFTLDLSGTNDYQLGIVNKAWTPIKNGMLNGEVFPPNGKRYFDATIKCDADFKIKKSLFSKSVSKNKEVNFRIYEQTDSSPQTILYFNQQVSSCEVYFKKFNHPEINYGVKLVSDLKEKSHLAELKNRFETCILPDASSFKGPEKLFLTPKYNSMTCPLEVNDIKTLEEPVEGLKAKAETLLGQPLPEDFITKLNPYADLDFSRAPKFNTVLISYLVFRNDFYGAVIARLAKWHADHGVKVYILISDVIALEKDRLMLHKLAESSNNIKLQEFKYDSDGGGLWDHFSELHRTMHVKLLITLSDEPANNEVYIGGRNIHDGFVFMKKPDLSAFPELNQYGDKKGSDESYAPWRDYEMKIRSKTFAEEMASHYMTLWQRDSQNFYIRSINQNIVSQTPVDQNYFDRAEETALVRHFMSIPYKDDDALEKFYVEVIDSAEKSIRISTPYFRPTKKLGDAIARAIARGVEISLITRLELKGDTADIILSDANKGGVNRFLHKIKMYEYTEPGVILHSKILLVDGKVSYIGSVNLNKRSFVHDIESGVMVYNSAYNKKMNQIMDVYLKDSREITTKQKTIFWKQVVIGIFDTEL